MPVLNGGKLSLRMDHWCTVGNGPESNFSVSCCMFGSVDILKSIRLIS